MSHRQKMIFFFCQNLIALRECAYNTKCTRNGRSPILIAQLWLLTHAWEWNLADGKVEAAEYFAKRCNASMRRPAAYLSLGNK